MSGEIWTLERGEGPIVATAIHDGHEVRDEVGSLLALDEAGRLREEDPFTGDWTTIAPTRGRPQPPARNSGLPYAG